MRMYNTSYRLCAIRWCLLSNEINGDHSKDIPYITLLPKTELSQEYKCILCIIYLSDNYGIQMTMMPMT